MPGFFSKLKIGKVYYKTLSDVKTETSISVCYYSPNTSKLIAPFLKNFESTHSVKFAFNKNKVFRDINGNLWELEGASKSHVKLYVKYS